METRTENFLSMTGKLAAYFANHAADITTVLPIFPSQRTLFNTKRSGMIATAVLASTDITGHAVAKANAQKDVEESTLKVGLACAGYYTLTVPDPGKKNVTDWNKSELERMRDNDLYVAGLRTWTAADPIKALLLPFSVADTDVDDLNSQLATFFAIIETPLTMIEERSGLLLELDRRENDLRDFLNDSLDTIFAPLQVANPLIYDTYRACRSIDDAPATAGAGIIIAFVDPAQLREVDTGTAINSDTIAITFTNRTSVMANPLSVFFEDAAHTLGDPLTTSPQTVSPGETFTLTAGELGYSPTNHVLHVQNGDGSLPQSFRIEIG